MTNPAITDETSPSGAAGATGATGPAGPAGSGSTLQGYLFGLTLSNDATAPNTVIDVAAGSCVDSTAAAMITLSAFTKSTGGAWASGSGSSGLDVGTTVTDNTWYHVHAICQAGGANPDILLSKSATAPTLPSGYTLFRRLGSFLTFNNGSILSFYQFGDQFVWVNNTLDISVSDADPSATANTGTLTVPTGVVVEAIGNVEFAFETSGGGTIAFLVSPLAISAPTPSTTTNMNGLVFSGSATNSNSQLRCLTNTSGQIRYSFTSTSVKVGLFWTTIGWIDIRGKM